MTAKRRWYLALVADDRLKSTARAVGLHILEMVKPDADSGDCFAWMTLETLERRSAFERVAIVKARKLLVELGYLTRAGRVGKVPRFRLTIPDAVHGDPGLGSSDEAVQLQLLKLPRATVALGNVLPSATGVRPSQVAVDNFDSCPGQHIGLKDKNYNHPRD